MSTSACKRGRRCSSAVSSLHSTIGSASFADRPISTTASTRRRTAEGADAMPHQARKRFGQHFLVDEGVVESIVRAIAPARGDTVVEIGPGLTALTGLLLNALDHLTVVEIERDLAARLRRAYPEEQLTVVEGDALKVNYADLGAKLLIVGNLPYNMSR